MGEAVLQIGARAARLLSPAETQRNLVVATGKFI